MRTTNVSNQTTWKQFLQDAVLELDPRVFEERLEVVRKAIEDRLLELRSHDDPEPSELAELRDAQHTVSVLQREKNYMN